MSWNKLSLGECIETTKGFAFKSEWFGQDGIPVVKVKDFTADSIDDKDLSCLPVSMADTFAKYTLRAGDVIIQTVGSWPSNPNSVVGKVVKVPKEIDGALLNQNAVKINPNRKIDSKFLFYLLRVDGFKNYLIGTAQGSASQASITLDAIKAYVFSVPPLPVQQKIAGILSAYDDLIYNNRKRIALLEKAARLLYEEWFVRLQFPGHEHTPVMDGVPEGWEKAPVKSICYEVKDAVHPGQIEEGAAYIGLEHMPRKSITLQDWGQPEDVSSLKYRYLKGDILFGKIRPYFHKVGFTLNSGICSTDAIVLRPTQEKYYSLLLMYVSSDAFVNEATQSSNGTKMPRANWKHLEKLAVLIAPDVLLDTFSDYIKPILLQLENAAIQNQKLQQARDLLLPRLMSGGLAV